MPADTRSIPHPRKTEDILKAIGYGRGAMVKRCPTDPEGRLIYERDLNKKMDRLIVALPFALLVTCVLIAALSL